MSKIFALANDLKLCYETKYPYADDYIKITNSEKSNLCNPVRKALIDYVNSSEYSFYDIIHNLKGTKFENK